MSGPHSCKHLYLCALVGSLWPVGYVGFLCVLQKGIELLMFKLELSNVTFTEIAKRETTSM